MLIPGTTPRLTFTFPFDLSLLEDMLMTIQQCGKNVIERYMADFELEDDKAYVELTQAETLRLDENAPVLIQFRVKYATSGLLDASAIIRTDAYELLHEGALWDSE